VFVADLQSRWLGLGNSHWRNRRGRTWFLGGMSRYVTWAGGRDHELRYRPDLDGLRGVTILAVVGFHAFPTYVPGGFVGVDVFFVLSGYLISTIILEQLRRSTFTLADFYIRRARRLFPALATVLATCLLLGWFVLLPAELQSLGKHISAAAAFMLNFAVWHEGSYFDPVATLNPVLHLWSLGIEEQFYLVWPLVLLLLWRHQRSLPAIRSPTGGLAVRPRCWGRFLRAPWSHWFGKHSK
jgi:peptidoglycan/LPS O-acetylase OafA/YrhL